MILYDTNLLVPEIANVDINDEFNIVLKWAADNHMIVNLHKTKEIVFLRLLALVKFFFVKLKLITAETNCDTTHPGRCRA